MIKVIYYRKYNRLTIEGHAYAGEPGHDLVCAAASILAHTLAANVENMERISQVTQGVAVLEPGKAEIACRARGKFSAMTQYRMDAVCVGFEILAQQYPEYISYEIHGA